MNYKNKSADKKNKPKEKTNELKKTINKVSIKNIVKNKIDLPELKPKFAIIKNNKKDDNILKVNKITKVYGNFVALNQISFEMKRGEVIGLIGGNGAGKTTLAEIIAGIITPEAGTLEWGMEFEESYKENIGMQFQQFEYPSGLSVKDIVAFARNLRKLKMTNSELKEIMKQFRMNDFYKKKVNTLSGGQKQKLNILLSIMHKPDFLILDELSTGLDVIAREDIIAFTKDLIKKNNSSCILISHHMSEIEALCSKVIVLSKGKIVDTQSISDIKKKHNSLANYIKNMMRKRILTDNSKEGI